MPGLEKMQAIVANIPQLQIQIQQLDRNRMNPSLPKHVRQSAELQYQNLQMELQNAQGVAVSLVMVQQQQAHMQMQMNQMQQQQGLQQGWAQQLAQGQTVSNRRGVVRNLNGRPPDFLQVGGGQL